MRSKVCAHDVTERRMGVTFHDLILPLDDAGLNDEFVSKTSKIVTICLCYCAGRITVCRSRRQTMMMMM